MSEVENVQAVYESLKRDFPLLKEGKIDKKLIEAVGTKLFWIWLNWKCENAQKKETEQN